MAKLQNVKVIDAKDGEVTKIAYEGAEYTEIDVSRASVGDIAMVVEEFGTVIYGEFYTVEELYGNKNGSFASLDTNTVPFQSRLHYFRKVSAPSLEDRVTALEGEVETLKDGGKGTDKPIKTIRVQVNRTPQLKVGNYAKVIGGTNKATETGDIVKLLSVAYEDQGGGFVVADITGNELDGAKNSRFLTPATDEEVAAAKRKAEEKAKQAAHAKLFTDAGRKVGEYREGDIVQNRGELTEVVRGESSDSVILSGGNFRFKWNVKPIVFVENRLDRK